VCLCVCLSISLTGIGTGNGDGWQERGDVLIGGVWDGLYDTIEALRVGGCMACTKVARTFCLGLWWRGVRGIGGWRLWIQKLIQSLALVLKKEDLLF
jgi:hypothetical protein